MAQMTKAQVLARLHEIGEVFISDGLVDDDWDAYRERGIALGMAVGILAALPDAEFAELLGMLDRWCETGTPWIA